MKIILFYLLSLLSIANYAFSADEYRTYIQKIDGFSSYHRISSYNISDGKTEFPVDLFYYDSDTAPNGTDPLARVYQNHFSLIAVYKKANGEWTHQNIFAGARTMFRKVIKSDTKQIIIEFSPKFMLTSRGGDDITKVWKRQQEINKPYRMSFSWQNEKIISAKLKNQTKMENKSQ